MRALKRFLQARHESRIKPRLQEVLRALGEAMPEFADMRAFKSGHRGHDSTFYLEKNGKRLAVLRLNNPHFIRPDPVSDMPFMLASPSQRIAHELAAYSLGCAIDLTPAPLWHTHDALVCRYVARAPLADFDYFGIWDLLCRVNRPISALHSLGLTHMDMSLNNILADDACRHFTFIDFEYTPIPSLTAVSQRAYDYLRLLESCWKFIPAEIHGDYAQWLSEVREYMGTDMKHVQLDLLAPALTRILAAPSLGGAIRKKFVG